MTTLQQISSPPQASAEVVVNQNFQAVEQIAAYAMDATTTSVLNWGYVGGRWGGFPITAGTLALTASQTNYIVVAKATGVISVSTATTNWTDATNYARVYKVVTGTATVTAGSTEDHRGGPGGVHGGAGGGASAVSSVAGLTGAISASALNTALGTGTVPINSQSAAYTLVLADIGTCIYHPAADTTARTFTIPANASVAFAVGTVITFDNDFGAGVLTIAITTDTLVLVGTAGSTGSRTLAAGGQATAIKVGSARWRITGNGLT